MPATWRPWRTPSTPPAAPPPRSGRTRRRRPRPSRSASPATSAVPPARRRPGPRRGRRPRRPAPRRRRPRRRRSRPGSAVPALPGAHKTRAAGAGSGPRPSTKRVLSAAAADDQDGHRGIGDVMVRKDSDGVDSGPRPVCPCSPSSPWRSPLAPLAPPDSARRPAAPCWRSVRARGGPGRVCQPRRRARSFSTWREFDVGEASATFGRGRRLPARRPHAGSARPLRAGSIAPLVILSGASLRAESKDLWRAARAGPRSRLGPETASHQRSFDKLRMTGVRREHATALRAGRGRIRSLPRTRGPDAGRASGPTDPPTSTASAVHAPTAGSASGSGAGSSASAAVLDRPRVRRRVRRRRGEPGRAGDRRDAGFPAPAALPERRPRRVLGRPIRRPRPRRPVTAGASRNERRRFEGVGPGSRPGSTRIALRHNAVYAGLRLGAFPLGTTALYVQPSARLEAGRLPGRRRRRRPGDAGRARRAVPAGLLAAADGGGRLGGSVALRAGGRPARAPRTPERGLLAAVLAPPVPGVHHVRPVAWRGRRRRSTATSRSGAGRRSCSGPSAW